MVKPTLLLCSCLLTLANAASFSNDDTIRLTEEDCTQDLDDEHVVYPTEKVGWEVPSDTWPCTKRYPSLHDMMKLHSLISEKIKAFQYWLANMYCVVDGGYTRTKGKYHFEPNPASDNFQRSAYVRWGSDSCYAPAVKDRQYDYRHSVPEESEVYRGIMATAKDMSVVGGTNWVCLPATNHKNSTHPFIGKESYISVAMYSFGHAEGRQKNREARCVTCTTSLTTLITVVGDAKCPRTWILLYRGTLMAGKGNFLEESEDACTANYNAFGCRGKLDHVCVDDVRDADTRPKNKKTANDFGYKVFGAYFWPLTAYIGQNSTMGVANTKNIGSDYPWRVFFACAVCGKDVYDYRARPFENTDDKYADMVPQNQPYSEFRNRWFANQNSDYHECFGRMSSTRSTGYAYEVFLSNVKVTRTGKACRNWKGIYLRISEPFTCNVFNDRARRPWCVIDDSKSTGPRQGFGKEGEEWEYCDVPNCGDFAPRLDSQIEHILPGP